MCILIRLQWVCKECRNELESIRNSPIVEKCKDVLAGRECKGMRTTYEQASKPLGFTDSHKNCPESLENKAKQAQEEQERARKRARHEALEAARKKQIEQIHREEARERSEKKRREKKEQEERLVARQEAEMATQKANRRKKR